MTSSSTSTPVTKEVTNITGHPIDVFVRRHPLHTHFLDEHQFNLLCYGVIVDKDERLVLVKLPAVFDSESRIAREGKTVKRFLPEGGAGTKTESPATPSEHNLIVYRVPETWEGGEEEEAVPLFRLVFRDESGDAANPMYRLKNVFVSHIRFYNIIGRLRNLETTSEKEDIIKTSQIIFLVDMWMLFLENMHAVWSPSTVSTVRGVGDTWRTTTMTSTTSSAPEVVREVVKLAVPFDANMQRSIRRIQVLKRDGEAVAKWRDGEYNPRHARDCPEEQTLLSESATCYRVLMKTARGAVSVTDTNEICVPMPETLEYSSPVVYSSPAAECLRVWLAKALTAAEVHDIHSLFLEIDPFILFSVCVGLMSDDKQVHLGLSANRPTTGDEVPVKEQKMEVLCKIIVETVVDFLLHSGVIWDVYIAPFDYEETDTSLLCSVLLEQYWEYLSEAATQKKVNASLSNAVEQTTALESTAPLSEEGDGNLVKMDTTRGGTVNTNGGTPNNEHYLSRNVVNRANSSGVRLSDAEMRELFVALAGSDRVTELPVGYLVDILRLKMDPQAQNQVAFLFPFGHPLTALDNCGIPTDERSVTNFVMKYATRQAPRGGVKNPSNTSLNYEEFAMMMLALARM
ncbi:hypothetical protein AGDE_09399 [Angomonas deanei]|uniref:Paraflagellar rod component n=1 Tax=Angomonas deanei TaxID=59799 RepID=A0A7G2C3B0_9TRYP|nr:hypothetical protein AGDE_09399 [Angomonas deanei]CAD2213197.1 hypothetical protein, conserved [Angomonas deanei]|eukprot:EPY30526.1 hypothetical protein AGDE_09399 [Angomonas deanei]